MSEARGKGVMYFVFVAGVYIFFKSAKMNQLSGELLSAMSITTRRLSLSFCVTFRGNTPLKACTGRQVTTLDSEK